MPRHRAAIAGTTTAILVAAVMVVVTHNAAADAGPNALTGLDLSLGNRRAPISGLYDWSKAGYRGGANLPGSSDITSNQSCLITASELDTQYAVRGGDGVDDTTGLQSAIDAIRTGCSTSAGYSTLSLITLPAGILNVSREIHVDADYMIIRGAGSGAGGTRLVYRPDANTAYDTLTPDGSDWDEDGMTHGQGKGGWLWPGRGLFRVQSRGVHTSYASDYASAPANRKDIFEGTVNVHWKAGLKLRAKTGDAGFAARTGDTVVHLDSAASLTTLAPGKLVNIRAANSMKFYEQQQALPTTFPLQNLHMRQQIFTIAAVNSTNKTITLNKPLEYDVPVDSTSDGSAPIEGAVYLSKASPLIDPVVGVGFENFSFTQDMPGLSPANAVNNYGNMSPANEMHGIVFKWAADSWVRGVKAEMTGSHPIVTEEAYHLQIVNNELDGSWNKGKGGNGYFRGSRVWDSLYAGNTSRNLRHFTFQWSASGNVVVGNDSDSDLNLHGGWERNNLFELNTTRIPYQHRSGSCTANCGEEGGGAPDGSTWWPIWWGAGKKAVKWSGSSGPRNVFFNNTLSKQATSGGAYVDYYADHQRIYQFGWSGTAWKHLDVGGVPIADWAANEQRDYTGGHGLDATKTSTAPSLFLNSVNGAPTTPPTTSSPTASPTTSPTPPGPGVRYEAETATLFHGTIDSNHAGFSGTGFANPANEVGSYVEWQVNAAQAGPAKVDIRYANGTTVSRPMDISVNGSLAVDEQQFAGTGGWPTWKTIGVNLTLAAGANTIRLTSTIATGGPNLDYIEVGTPSGGNEVLLSRGKPATASSTEAAGFSADKAFDGVGTTRWASVEGSDPQWIRVDLGATATVTRVVLAWEAAYASGYQVQSSPDDATWTNVYSTSTGDGGTDTITGLYANTRYVRFHGTTRATAYGYSLWEFDVYGTTGGGGGGDTTPPTVPGNLRSTGATSNSVALAWDAATDNVGVTGYFVYRGAAQVATVFGTSYTDPGLTPSTSYTYTVRARDAAGNVSNSSNSVTASTTPAGSGPAVPFGSHLFPYPSGMLKPTGSQSTLDQAVIAKYNQWKSFFVRQNCGNGWYETISPDADHPYVAEAQGYGMVITATMAGADPNAKTIFDGMVKYVLAHPSVNNPNLLAAEQNTSCVSVNGSDSATDGDMDVAFALLLADRQWGSSGTYNYRNIAIQRINAIKASEVNPTTNLLKLGDWSSCCDALYWTTRPSDHMINHMRAFRAATGDPAWDTIRNAHQTLLTNLQNQFAPSTGLVPDFVIDTNTSPKPPPGQILESPNDGKFSWNSCRAPWRIGTDAVASADNASLASARKMNTWIKSKTAGNPAAITNGYTLAGATLESGNEACFVAPFAVAAMTDSGSQAWLDALWNNMVNRSFGNSDYYSFSVQLQVMIVASGNYWKP